LDGARTSGTEVSEQSDRPAGDELRRKMFDFHDDPTEEVTQDPKASKPTSQSGKEIQLDFELEFFERILERDPDYVAVLRVHASNLTAKGLYDRGLATDRQLIRLRPNDPVAHYNLACSYSLLHMNDAAIASLDSSLHLGYRDLERMLGDPDLAHVRKDARFVRLLGRYLLKLKKAGKSR
jgi:tetratricopeptide (TPR) repeat protein